ncbi:hypothetical protein GCM10010967_29310 [Dyadobacter beijingensis]|uniref:PD-(D/E)XK nuclease superfamily protein n=1 Tax=Dyadobacter beijingensis TaxID=365489 RepID=A0ABQ2HX57_9BACT|nr:hypothetical protein [Dyadobacter beijingensis]GGM94244.1 hypothetical protein GCM10010967_29310 [Dyadobacter beijingensis]
MFRLFEVFPTGRVEIFQIEDTFNVKELGDYEFEFFGRPLSQLDDDVFVEDLPLERNLYIAKFDSVVSTKASKLFQDYFGAASFSIRGEVFKMNIQIEKFRVSEIEEILLFLWVNDNKIFDNFFSKSSIKSSVGRDGSAYNLTSKFILFSHAFCEVFESLLPAFTKLPRSKFSKNEEIVDYSPRVISEKSLDWLVQNLDEVRFDASYRNHPDSIPIASNFGYIQRIATDAVYSNKNTFENSIILGSFKYLLLTINSLKSSIQSAVPIKQEFSSKEYADFRDLKKVPYLKLLRDSEYLEVKLKILFAKYQNIFVDTRVKLGRPRMTNVFSHVSHYRQAYKIIATVYDYKLRLDGAFDLLNVRKLSQLYEIYNLHQIVHGLTENLNMSVFSVNFTSSRNDGITNLVSFSYREYAISVYYEMQYPNSLTDQIRLDTRAGSYYKPDYVIEINTPDVTLNFILDSKYSRYQVVKYKYLNDAIFKYILNTGFRNNRYKKVDGLVLIFPGEHDEVVVLGQNYSPQIRLISSKPKFDSGLRNFIASILDGVLPSMLRI